MLGLVVGDEPFLARPVADGVPDRVAEVGREPALLDLEHLVPAARLVEAERRAGRRLRERVLELVAVEERRRGGEDRIERRLRDPADPLERVSNLVFLRRSLHRVVEILEAAAAAGRVVRARRLDALRRRLEHLRRERLGEPALHLRHARAHAIARKPAPDEDDEAVQARDAVAAVGERVDLELELLVHASPARPSPQGTSGDVAAAVRRRPATPSAAIQPSETATPASRRAVVAACRRRRVERAERAGTRRRRRCREPERPTSSVSTMKNQTSVPTSAATWLCTTAPIADPEQHPEHDREEPERAASTTSRRRTASRPSTSEPRSATRARPRAPASAKPVATTPRRPSSRQHPLAVRCGEKGRRDRSVPELGRHDRDPEDDRDRTANADRRRRASQLEVERRCARTQRRDPICAGAPIADESTSTTTYAHQLRVVRSFSSSERKSAITASSPRRSARGRPPRASRARRRARAGRPRSPPRARRPAPAEVTRSASVSSGDAASRPARSVAQPLRLRASARASRPARAGEHLGRSSPARRAGRGG